jgi:hypothetical protein
MYVGAGLATAMDGGSDENAGAILVLATNLRRFIASRARSYIELSVIVLILIASSR